MSRQVQTAPAYSRTLILLRCCTLAVGLATVVALTAPINLTLAFWLSAVVWLCQAVFVIELVHDLSRQPDCETRWNYLKSPAGLVHILAILPIPLGFLLGLPWATTYLLGSLWILKLTKFVPGFSLLGRVIALEARPLGSVLIIFLIVLVFASVALFVLEKDAQPQKFGSLPLSLWWAVTTLTTTGYGDAVPESFLGRLVAGFVMICGLGVFGLWTGILANGFAAEHRRRDFIRNWQLVLRVPLFSGLDPTAAIELARMLRRIDVMEKTMVVKKGRPGDCMYFIAEGEVEVRIEPRPVRLGAGEFFGEIALLDGRPRMANVVTTRPSTLLVLEVADFQSFTAAHPEIAEQVEREAAKRTSIDKILAKNRDAARVPERISQA